MNGLKWSWPELRATGVTHTVETKHGRRAGFLVRSSASTVELGHIWPAGNAWMYRLPNGKTGERSSQTAAVRVLRDAYDAHLLRDQDGDASPALPFEGGEERAEMPLSPAPKTGRTKPPPRLPPGFLPPRASPPRPPKPNGPTAPPQPPPATGLAEGFTGPRIKWGEVASDVTDALAAALARAKK